VLVFVIMVVFVLYLILVDYSNGLRGGLPGFDSRMGKDFSLIHSVQPALGLTQPPIQWAPRILSPGVKWPGRVVDHSPPPSAGVKNGGAIPPLLHMSSWNSA
jgi:hypothetical protein